MNQQNNIFTQGYLANQKARDELAQQQIEPRSTFWDGVNLKVRALEAAIRAGAPVDRLIEVSRQIEAYLEEARK